MGGNGRHRWFPFHHRSSSSSSSLKTQKPPTEFLCPISGSIMSDPVVISSGQTFERTSVRVCLDLGFVPELEDGSKPDFSTVITNLNMRSTITSWCDRFNVDHPQPPDYSSVETIVSSKMSPEIRASEVELLQAVADRQPAAVGHHADTEVMGRGRRPSSDTSEEFSVVAPMRPFTPLPLTTRPACVSSPSSSSSGIVDGIEIETLTHNSFFTSSSSSSSSQPSSPEEEQIYNKLKGPDIFDQEQGLILLRRMTRTNDEIRVSLCTSRILLFLRSLIVSRYSLAQINALASLVNLSLKKKNKVTIVRSEFVPLLIDILKSGSAEAQDLAAGAIFSLALEDENKTPIGVLGALPPLLHALRDAESDRTRHDAALALYHLTLNQANRSKLIRLGAVPALLSMVGSGESSAASRVLLVICNLASSGEGRAAMLDANAVAILVGKLRDGGASGSSRSEAARENCVAALYALSHGNMRFKGLAREARAVDALKEVEERGTERAREKARKILQMMKERDPAEEDSGHGGDENFDWVLDSNVLTRTRNQLGRNGTYSPNSSNF